MSRRQSDKATATFIDLTTCFPEEEWQLLDEWQKELYKNVMKEVHQALISLGPLIASTVFSLTAKEHEDPCFLDHQDLERRHFNLSSSDKNVNLHVLCNTNKEENKYLTAPKNTEEKEIHDCVITVEGGHQSLVSVSIKEEAERYSMDHQECENLESISFPTEHMVNTSIISFPMKEEAGSYSVEQNCSRRENISMPVGLNTSVNSTKKQASLWERTSVSIEPERHLSHKRDVISHQRFKQGESLVTCSEFGSRMNRVSTTVKQKEIHREDNSWNECAKSLRGSSSMNPYPKTHTVLKVYICCECGNTFKKSEVNSVHQINKTGQPNTCGKCTRSLQKPTNLNNDQGKYLGEKPYTCRECGKSFQNSRTLMIHQRVHTGEKPYTCSQCGKAFRQLPHLVVHQRLHTGEKPYVCNICDSRFINTSNLKRHQQIHTRD
ncbi:zinc finger protein 250-like isoform X2 [Ambystoma mexicanum]|uniref:zinc finger protein 250-like isoform X2 n=1 Tax=Ambystoma mexicanum TaxID=8296 RepID=UPI0037E99206